jgi:hypothetical protein
MIKNVVFLILFFISLLSATKSYAQNIPMTLHNGSFWSIYLNIPGVMNPNLSPKSNSGVSLNAGQEVFFFPNGKRGKKELLFIVSPAWRRDTILAIDEMISSRKKSLGF